MFDIIPRQWTRHFLAEPVLHRRSPRRLTVEQLEDRTVPSAYVVDILGDAGTGLELTGDLRYCLNQANTLAGDDTVTISVQGVINLLSALPVLNSNLIVQGPGADLLTVQRDPGAALFSVFQVNAGNTVTISGMTITGGESARGGGIYNAGTLVVTDVAVTGNLASSQGGGLFNAVGGTLEINRGTIDNNTTFEGGGIANKGTLTINDVSIDGNTASGSGGGLYNQSGTATITGGTVSMNNAAQGAGIFNPSTLSATSLTIQGNNSVYSGGGIESWGTLTLSNSTVSGNTAGTDGGGLFLLAASYSGTESLVNVTVADNAADSDRDGIGQGGGIYVSGSAQQPLLKNTLVAGNTRGAGIANDISGVVSGSYNLIGDGSGGLDPALHNLKNVDPLLGPLASNGGTTMTHALLAGSPAINAGNNADAPAATDQRGEPRIVDGAIDIGAFEYRVGSVVNFTFSTSTVPEGVGAVTVTAFADRTQPVDVVIPLTLTGTAANVADYTLDSSTLVIPAGSISGSVTLNIVNDITDEPDETAILTMGTPTNASLGTPSSATITVTDDDPAPQVAFTTSSQTAAEGSTISVTARLGQPSTNVVTIPLVFTGTADPSADYTTSAGSIVIPAGEVFGGITVTPLADPASESAELIIIGMGDPTNAVASPYAPTSQVITIPTNGASVSFSSASRIVDESAGVVAVTAVLSEAAAADVTVPLVFSETAARGTLPTSDYFAYADAACTIPADSLFFAAGTTSTTLYLKVNDDAIDEEQENAGVRMEVPLAGLARLGTTAGYVLQINDNDTAKVNLTTAAQEVWEDGPGSSDLTVVPITARLTNPSVQDVVVPIVLSGGTATANTDYTLPNTVITIPAGQMMGSTSLTVAKDSTLESKETIILKTGAITGALAGTVTAQKITIWDNDPTVSFAASAESVVENTVDVAIRVVLSAPTNKEVRVPFTVTSTATKSPAKNSDFKIKSPADGVVVIPSLATSGVVTIGIFGDGDPEKDETVKLTMGTPTNATAGSKKTDTLTIVDNDFPTVGFVNDSYFKDTKFQLSESALNPSKYVPYTITVRLTQPAAKEVTIDLGIGGTATKGVDYTISKERLTIGVGKQDASFTITPINDSLPEVGEESIVLTFKKVTNASPGKSNKFTFNLLDNDPPSALPTPIPNFTTPQVATGATYTEVVPGATPAINPGALNVEVAAGPAGPLYSVDSTGLPDLQTLASGGFALEVANEGLIAGGLVFLDANKNGVLDFLDFNGDGVQSADEPTEMAAVTGLDGRFSITFPEVFDINGNGYIDASEGDMVLKGGIDVSTGLPMTLPMRAPAGSFTITPLMTLVTELMEQQGLSMEDAEQRVLEALSLPAFDLAHIDSVGSLLGENTDAPFIVAANTKLHDTVVQAASLIGGYLPSLDLEFLAERAVADLARKIADPFASLDLSNAFTMETILRGVAGEVGLVIPDSVISGAAQVMAAGSRYIDAIPRTSDLGYLMHLAKVQTVEQGITATELARVGLGTMPIEDVVTNGTGANLVARIAGVPDRNVIPPYVSITSTAMVEGNNGETWAEFTVSLAGATTAPVSVEWATAEQTATAGSDFEVSGGTLTWVPGDLTDRTIRVAVHGDNVLESDEQFLVVLGNASDAVFRRNVGIADILNDEPIAWTAPAGSEPNELVLTLKDENLELRRYLGQGEDRVAQVELSGTFSRPVPILIQGADGVDDFLTVEIVGQSSTLMGGMTYIGGAGVNDRFTLIDGTAHQVAFNPTSPDAGSLTIDGALVSYSGVEFVTDGVAAGLSGVPIHGSLGTPVVVGTTVPNPDLLGSYGYTWQVTREGTPYAGNVLGDSFSFTPIDPGLYAVNVLLTADGVGDGRTFQSFEVTGVSATVDAGPDMAANEGEWVDLSFNVHDLNVEHTRNAAIDWGDGTVETLPDVAANIAVVSTHRYLDNLPGDAPYTIVVTVTNSAGAVDTATAEVVVRNVAPTSDAGPETRKVRVGETVSLHGTWTDPGTLDTHARGWAIVDNATGKVVGGGDGVDVVFTPSAPGTYTAAFRTTDDDGGSHEDTTLIKVAKTLDSTHVLAVAADAGGGPHVRVYDAASGAEKFSFYAYDAGFTGGVRTAVGDVTGDGITDIITGTGPGAGPHVKVFDGTSGVELMSFYAFAPTFTAGIDVASGDVNGDGYDDVIVGAGPGAGPHLMVFSGDDGSVMHSFYAYDAGFSGGVRVAAGDFTGDGKAEIVTGAGPGAGPHVMVREAMSLAVLDSFYAYAPSFGGGVTVAVGDVTGDGVPDLLTGSDNTPFSQIRVLDGATGTERASFFAHGVSELPMPGHAGGVRVAAVDVIGDGRAEAIVASGPGRPPLVKVFDALTAKELDDFFAFDPVFRGGLFVAGR